MTNKQVVYKNIDNFRVRCNFVKRNDFLPTIVFLHEPYKNIEYWYSFPDKLGITTKLNTLVYERQLDAAYPVAKSKSDQLYTGLELLNKLIESLGLNELILVGHSLGGMVALLEAAMYPEKVKGVIAEQSLINDTKETLFITCPLLTLQTPKDEYRVIKKEMAEDLIESAFFIYRNKLNGSYIDTVRTTSKDFSLIL